MHQEKTPKNFSLRGFIQITRLWNLLIVVLAQYFTAVFLINNGNWLLTIKDYRLFLLSLSTVLIAAAGYIINDYYDVKIDLINKPQRVIVGKVLKRRVAMLSHTFLNITGVLIGALLSWPIALLNFISALLLWLYSNQLKRMPFIGNLVVAFLTGLSIYIVSILYHVNNKVVIAYALFSFSFTLIREIVKDIEDLKGDKTFGCKTLPIVFGIRKTKFFIYILSIATVIILVFLARTFVGHQLTVMCMLLSIPLGYLAYELSKADTTKQFNRLSIYCKVIMLIGILSMALF